MTNPTQEEMCSEDCNQEDCIGPHPTPTPRGWEERKKELSRLMYTEGLDIIVSAKILVMVEEAFQQQLEEAYKEGYIDGGLNH